MRTAGVVLWAVALGGSLAAVGFSARAAASARRDAADALAQLQAAADQAAEIHRLRSAAPPWAAKGPPSGGLAPRISAALAAAGLPPASLAGLSAEKDLDAGGSPGGRRAMRRRATLALTGVTLPQVGAFLAAWREREADWTVSEVDLGPEHGKAPPQGGDLPLRATIVIEAVYVDETPSDPGERR